MLIFDEPLIPCILAGVAGGLAAWFIVHRFRTSYARSDRQRRSAYLESRYDQAVRRSQIFALCVVPLAWLAPAARLVQLRWLRGHLGREAERAGWPGGLDVDEWLVMSVIAGVGAAFVTIALVAVMFGRAWMPVGALGLLLGPLVVSAGLAQRGGIRQHRIVRAMPYVLDLIVLATRSGASFLIALRRIALDYQKHPIGDEFQRALSEIEFGMPRRSALERLAGRTDAPEIKSFVENVQQSEDLGRPLADTLERLSDRLAIQRVNNAETMAGKASVSVLLPSTLIMVSVLMILFAPFIMRWASGDYQF